LAIARLESTLAALQLTLATERGKAIDLAEPAAEHELTSALAYFSSH
jgi:hypothetical protein